MTAREKTGARGMALPLNPAWFSGEGPESDVIISTRVRLARNLAGHRFPFRASLNERKKAFAEIWGALQRIPQYNVFDFINFTDLTELQREILVEERIVSPELLSRDGDRGVVSDSSRRINLMVNEEDHLRLQNMDAGYRPRALWEMLNIIDDVLGRSLAFAFESSRGFLTSCPTNSGTGLRVSFLMHLPGLVLTKTIDQVLQGAAQMGLAVRGFFGEHSDSVGNFFQLSNQATMGASENEFIEGTCGIIEKTVGFEREARKRILRDASLELSDKIFRSWGIMLHARTLRVDEFLNLASAVRLGIACGIFDLISADSLNRLTMLVLPAHLQAYGKRIMNEEEQALSRAALVRAVFEKESRRRKRARRGVQSGTTV
jgi:protein arginine kinase